MGLEINLINKIAHFIYCSDKQILFKQLKQQQLQQVLKEVHVYVKPYLRLDLFRRIQIPSTYFALVCNIQK